MERFTWQPGDIIVTGCPICIELTDQILAVVSADELSLLEAAFSVHAETHDAPAPRPAMFDEFRKLPD